MKYQTKLKTSSKIYWKRIQKKRFSADQALNHIWFKKTRTNKDIPRLSINSWKNINKNLINFQSNQKLQQASLAFIVHNLVSKEQTTVLRKAFNEFDENGDGHLTKEELEKGLLKIMTPSEAKAEVERVFNTMDTDGNGFIEYEEFLRASINKEQILTENNLNQAFHLFDKNNSGKISADEIKNVFGAEGFSDEIFSQIIKEVDMDGDGEISFEEFKLVMGKLYK